MSLLIARCKKTTLRTPLDAAASSIKVQALVLATTGLPLAFSSVGEFIVVVVKQGDVSEQIKCTGITQNVDGTADLAIDASGRKLLDVSPYTGSATGFDFQTGDVIVTNDMLTMSRYASLDNANIWDEVQTFAVANRPKLSSDVDSTVNEELVTFGQLSRVSFAGTVNGSTTVKGIFEGGTDAELQAGTGTGGTGALNVALASSFNQTAAANKVPVAKSTAKIDDGWLGLSLAGQIAYSDGTDLQPLTIGAAGTYLRSTGSAPSWGGANLDEANTFFGITNITGAQANTLSGGPTSNADTEHTHTIAAHIKAMIISGDLGLVGSAGANKISSRGMVQVTTDPTGANLYVYFKSATDADGVLGRFTRDAVTGNYTYVSKTAVTGFSAGSTTVAGVWAGSTFVFVAGKNNAGSNILIKRHALDLSGVTTMTISGTALTSETGPCAGNDTNAFIRTVGASTVVSVYTIAGTTATRGTDINLTSNENVCAGFFFDGTSLYNCTVSALTTTQKHTIAGALSSTTTGMRFSNLNVNLTNVDEMLQGVICGLGAYKSNGLYEFAFLTSTQVGAGSGCYWIEGLAFTKP